MTKYKQIAIIGPGLIGGSILLALKKRQLAGRLHVWTRRPADAEKVKEATSAHIASSDLVQVVKNSSIVILCTPVSTMAELVQTFLPHLNQETIVTDVGSVKGYVEQTLAPMLKGHAQWIGSHPMAGSEKQGFSAANANLFEGATVAITPTKETPASTEETIQEFWKDLGGNILKLSPETHDLWAAEISHLPFLTATLLVQTASLESLDLRGSGFRDATRVAGGSPSLWTDIIMQNRDAVLKSLREFSSRSQELYNILEKKDAEALNALLTKASSIRNALSFQSKNYESN